MVQHILVIDELKSNLKAVEESLSGVYTLIMTDKGDEALDYLNHLKPDLILLNPKVKTTLGTPVHEEIYANEKNKGQLLIFLVDDITEMTHLLPFLEKDTVDYVQMPYGPENLRIRINKALKHKKLQRDKQETEKKANQELEYITLQSFITVANIIDIKVNQFHSRRTAYYATRIALKLGWDDEQVMQLYYTALLHDIGMVGVSDSLLAQTGELTEEEYEEIKSHVNIGADLLSDIMLLGDAGEIIRCHHERYDGKGYPAGLRGENIPLAARIITLADSYDAMTSDRTYRTALGKEKIKQELEECSGAQFDPQLVNVLLELLDEGLVYMDSWGIFEKNNTFNLAQEGNLLLQKIVLDYTEEVKSVAHRDALTGLWNRGYTENHINQFLRNEENTGVLFMIDMDNFKTINDKFGHQEGDQLLVDFAKMVQECVRKDDIICRLGGDEFMIFMKHLNDRQKIQERAEILLKKFRQYLNGIEEYNILSLSMGIAVASVDGRDFASLYQNADKALYYVKKNGKNCYHFISEEAYNSTLEVQKGKQIDLMHLKNALEEKTPITGVYEVSYEDFKRIYQLLQRILLRSKRAVQMLLFSLNQAKETHISEEKREIALNDLGKVIAKSLRCGDIATNYSQSQYLVILMDAGLEDGFKVGERIVHNYQKMSTVVQMELRFDLAEVEKSQQFFDADKY